MSFGSTKHSYLLMLLLRGHVSHEVVDELLHLLDVLCGVRLVLQADDVVRHLHLQGAGRVVVLDVVAGLKQERERE